MDGGDIVRTTSLTNAQPYKEVNGVFQYVVELRCDAIADVTPAHSQWAVGSVAFEISTGKIYGLSADNGVYSWVEQ